MNFEELLQTEYQKLDEAAMPVQQKETVTALTKSGWDISDKADGSVTVAKDGSTLRVSADGKSFLMKEGTEIDVTALIAEGEEVDMDKLAEALAEEKKDI